MNRHHTLARLQLDWEEEGALAAFRATCARIRWLARLHRAEIPGLALLLPAALLLFAALWIVTP